MSQKIPYFANTEFLRDNFLSVNSSCCPRGGRPSGSTNRNKRKRTENIIAMKNDITREYIEFKKSKKSNTPKGVLEKIIKKHTKKET